MYRYITVMVVVLSLWVAVSPLQCMEIDDRENRAVWGIEPNTIANPGFEVVDSNGRPAYWNERLPQAASLSDFQSKHGFTRKVNLLNGGFEELDEKGTFFKYAKLRKIGRVKYHKDVWRSGVDLQAYLKSNLFNTGDMYPCVEEKIVRDGSRALKFQVVNSRGFSWSEIYSGNVFNVLPSTEYIVSFSVYQSGPADIYGSVYLHLGGRKYIKLPSLDRNRRRNWQKYTFSFKTDAVTSGPSALQFWGTCKRAGISGAVIFDNIEIFSREERLRCWKIVEDDTGQSGKCLAISETAGSWALTGKTVGIDWHKNYRLSALVRAEKTTGMNRLQVNWKRYVGDAGEMADWETMAVTVGPVLNGTFDWRKIDMELRPPRGAQFMEVELYSKGNRGRWLVDDLFMDGFGAQPVEFLMSQAGFESRGYKDVLIRVKQKFTVPVTLAIYAAGSKTGVVLSRNMTYRGRCKWGAYYYGTDISDWTAEGTYYARVTAGRTVKADSPIFSVKKGIYRELARHAAEFFFYQRSGYDIPGWRKACYLDDAWITDFGTSQKFEHKNLTGGWFDAADFNKWLNPAGWYVRALASTYDRLQDDNRNFLKGDLPDMLAEAEWGADYIRKSYKGNGDFYFCVKVHDARTPPEQDSDNIPGNEDDRCSNTVFQVPCGTLGLASMGTVLKNVDSNRSERYLAAAEDAFGYQVKNAGIVNKLRGLTEENINLTMAAIDLHGATGSAEYERFAAEHVRSIAEACLKGEHLGPPIDVSEENKLMYYIDVMTEFVNAFPATEGSKLCREALSTIADQMMAASSISPLNHTQTLARDLSDSQIFLSLSRSNTYPLSCASQLAAMSVVLDRPELLRQAERDLQYVLGRNFQGTSCMADVGWKWGAHFSHLFVCPGHENGIIPYGVAKGHAIGDQFFRKGMPYAVMPGIYSPGMEEWNLEIYGETQSCLLNALSNIVTAIERGVYQR
ncbi:MAG: glycoside hydrolase family 9 protein [bacterium]|nr:glycoside hydrolase family 9 protein [bacterium]